jgi:Inorganic pyrophosphatase/exopolyphosphatase
MEKILVTGHRNPDMDSITSAYAYAALKNKLDPSNEYIACALGPLTPKCQMLFDQLNLAPPAFIGDVRARVKSIKRTPTLLVAPDAPVYELMNMYYTANPSVVPIMENGNYLGLLSVDDINRYFLRENRGERPEYNFSVDNIPKVLRGSFLSKGKVAKFHAPLMVGAMHFEVFKEHLKACREKPLLVVGARKDHIREAIKSNLPGLILTGIKEDSLEGIDFSNYDGMVFITYEETAEALRLLRLAIPVSDLLKSEKQKSVPESMLFDEAKSILNDSGLRGLSVFDDERNWTGFITRRCFLDRPRQKLILVDHNEAEQSVIGIEDAEIIEIVDHHRLAAPKTRNPIYIQSEPVGSTCTIVAELYERFGIKPDENIARILLSGLVSDTVMLKSPTTTSVDRVVAERLSKAAGISDFNAFCEQLFSSGFSLKNQDPKKIIEADFKRYEENDVRFGIGQVEVTTLSEIKDISASYINALGEECANMKLDWAMLLVTDVITASSVLLCSPFTKSYRLIYEKLEDGVYSLQNVLSRKKQLLPEVLRVLKND